jgi:hypothetical protein
MSRWDMTDEEQKAYDAMIEAAKIDGDLISAVEHNGQAWKLEDVRLVLAVIEGENDGASWHWIIAMKNGQALYVTGGCDYTGWD